MNIFKLKSGDGDFKDRQKKVFDQLLVLENNRRNTDPSQESHRMDTPNKKVQRHETRQFRRKESIFKKPQNPAPRNYINKMPDFKKNPHKWTKYSLEDVQEMTDESNKKAAMDFLKELADRRKIEAGVIEEKLDELPSKIVFNKHVKRPNLKEPSESQQEESSGPSFRNSKLIMPEYVIGQNPVKSKREKHQKGIKPDKGVALKLDHLDYEDE